MKIQEVAAAKSTMGSGESQCKELLMELIIMILMNNVNDGDFQKKQEEEDERVRKEIKEYEQVKSKTKYLSWDPGR